MEYLLVNIDSIPEIVLAHYFTSMEYDSGWRKMQGIEIMIADKCDWHIEIMGKNFIQKPMQICTLPLSTLHRVKTQGTGGISGAHFALHFIFKGSCSVLSKEEFSEHVSFLLSKNTDVLNVYQNRLFLPLLSDDEDYTPVLPLFKEIIKEWTGKEIYSKYAASVTLQRMLVGISRLCINKITGYLENHNRYAKDTIIRTILFISENFQTIESIQDVADHLNLNPSYLGSIFKSHMGIPIVNYLNNLRVDRAKILIQDTNLSFKEIGDRVGVGNPYYFSSLFKKHTGMTMSEYARIILR